MRKNVPMLRPGHAEPVAHLYTGVKFQIEFDNGPVFTIRAMGYGKNMYHVSVEPNYLGIVGIDFSKNADVEIIEVPA